MKNHPGFGCIHYLIALFIWLPSQLTGQIIQTQVLYQTGFEASEGYDSRFTLWGQNGWIFDGSGGNGIISNYFQGYGQQAYLGYAAPSTTDSSLNIWRPISFNPATNNLYRVEFSVLMMIVGSANGHPDDFRWSVYNASSARLFSIDFDVSSKLISYALDDQKGYVSTGFSFETNVLYDLTVLMDFKLNQWSAVMNGLTVANGLPLTTVGSAMTLGDVGAVWEILKPGLAGDNYLIFDDYKVVAAASQPTQNSYKALLTPYGFIKQGNFLLRLHGEAKRNYNILISTDLVHWMPILSTTTSDTGIADIIDTTTTRDLLRYYRAELVN